MIDRLKRMPFAWWVTLPFGALLFASLAWKTSHAFGWSGPPPAWVEPGGPYLLLVIVLLMISAEQLRAARGLPPKPVLGAPLRHYVVLFIAIAAFMLIMDAATISASPTAPG